MAAHDDPPVQPQAADSLALAMTASSSGPLLLLDGALSVIAASDSFCEAFGIEPTTVRGKSFTDLGEGEWNVPQIRSLLVATASGIAAIAAYETDLARKGHAIRRLVLNATKLDYGQPDNVRLLLSVTDVTDARTDSRLKDDLLREKAVLMQELQHRIANSLQIIASVLMQSARRVQSAETREYLRDAHHRVMSVAAVQRQLAASTVGDVALRSYLTDLCWSIGTSMISDPKRLTLEVTADDGVAGADASVSMGLVVTELVINALKHAFPGRRHGKIKVDYRGYGEGWTLSVSDNGVGMQPGATTVTAGLGTSIVQALAQQLRATVHIGPANPGTIVSIIRS